MSTTISLLFDFLPRGRKSPSGTESDDQTNNSHRLLLEHAQQVLLIYVRLAIEKANLALGKESKDKQTLVELGKKIKSRFESSYQSAEMKSRFQKVWKWQTLLSLFNTNFSPLRHLQNEKDLIAKTIDETRELLRTRNISMDKAVESFLKKDFRTDYQDACRTYTILSIVPELSLFLEDSRRELRQLKYGEFEIANALAWYNFGPDVPDPDITTKMLTTVLHCRLAVTAGRTNVLYTTTPEYLSHAYDLVSHASGLDIFSCLKPIQDDRGPLRKPEDKHKKRNLDKIFAIALIELIDRTIKHVENVDLLTDMKTKVCCLGEFVAMVARVAISRSSGLSDRIEHNTVQKGLIRQVMDDEFEENKLLFSMTETPLLLEKLFGTKQVLLEWYQTHILAQRGGLTNFLLSLLYCSHGQFQIYSHMRYSFSMCDGSVEGEYEKEARELDEDMEKKYKLKDSVTIFKGVVVKKQRPLARIIPIVLVFGTLLVCIGLSVWVVRITKTKGLVTILEVVSVFVFGAFGLVLSLWQVLSSQNRPIIFALRGLRELKELKDIFPSCHLRQLSQREQQEELDKLRQWLASTGFGGNLPGIDVFLPDGEKCSLVDQKGIRVDHLSKVTLCDGFYFARKKGERARRFIRAGDNLRINRIVEDYAIVVSESNICRMRVGGG